MRRGDPPQSCVFLLVCFAISQTVKGTLKTKHPQQCQFQGKAVVKPCVEHTEELPYNKETLSQSKLSPEKWVQSPVVLIC